MTMISNCHYDFSQEIDIGFEATSEFTRATPSKVKEKFAKLKTDLTLMINKWERSGQGDGGIADDIDDIDDDEYGDLPSSIEGESPSNHQVSTREPRFEWGRSAGRTGAFDCREAFLGSNPSYLLYYWDVLDNNDLFNTAINRMSDETGASSANEVPPVLLVKDGKSNNDGKTNDNVSVFMKSFREVLVEANKDALVAAERRHEEDKKEHERRHMEALHAEERRHKESIEAEDKRLLVKSTAAENRVILQAQLDNKGYLKRRIHNLEDEARKVRFKIFECQASRNSMEEEFYNLELTTIKEEISKCKAELES